MKQYTSPSSEGRCLLLLLLLVTSYFSAIAQNYQSYFWYMGDKQINMSNYSVPNPVTITGSPPHAKYVASGAYFTGSNNSPVTEFSVSDNFVHQYDAINGLVSQELFDLNSTGACGDGTCFGSPGAEIIAIPKPGSECGSYYIIWSSYNTSASATFQKIATLGYSSYSTDLSLTNNTLNTCAIINQSSNGDPFAPSFAVSKKLANGNRYLYAVVPYYNNSISMNVTTRVYKYDITPSGITQTDLTPGLTNDYIEFQGVIAPSETELSLDQTRLAFARTNTTFYPNFGLSNAQDLVIIKLDASTGNLLGGSMGNVLTYNLTDHNMSGDDYSGLEFTTDNATLYINDVGDGIRPFTLSTGSFGSTIVPLSNNYASSQLELRYFSSGSSDQRICAVKNNSGTFEIGYINTSANTMSQNTGLSSFTYSVSNTFSKTNSIYTLQDQVDGEDYSTWTSPNNSVACCTRYYAPNSNDYTLPSTMTWSPGVGNNPWNAIGDLIFSGTFTIPANRVLTINNMTIRFQPGAKIVIQAGTGAFQSAGRLYLSGTTLAGLSCGNQTWNGVRVLGNPSATVHTIDWHGYLNMNNNSVIRDATIGAATYNYEAGGSSGGIIQTANVFFTDNKADLVMPTFNSGPSNPGNTFLDYTTFSIDNNYRFGTQVADRVQMTGIYRVLLRGWKSR